MATATVEVQSTREVAQMVREFGRQNGYVVGERGRLSTDLFADFFYRQPRTAKAAAALVGMTFPARGRISKADAERLALAVR